MIKGYGSIQEGNLIQISGGQGLPLGEQIARMRHGNGQELAKSRGLGKADGDKFKELRAVK